MHQLKPDKVGAVLLAAGCSTRFGSNKLLFSLDGSPIIARVLENVENLPFAGRVVVTQYSEIEALAKSQQIPSVRNAYPKRGISYSIRLGIDRLSDMDGWMFLVCDQPWLKKDTIEKLLKAWQNSPKGIAALKSGGVPGNPVIFSSHYKEDLKALQGDHGGKSILRSHMEDVLLVEAKAEELKDMDYFP